MLRKCVVNRYLKEYSKKLTETDNLIYTIECDVDKVYNKIILECQIMH